MDASSLPDGDAAPGWDAIDAALTALYPSQQPRHVGYGLPAALSDNLQGCSAYAAEGHWHYVTYGLSELYEPAEDDDPEWSGWGFELTLRVPGDPGTEPPTWPFVAVNQLAKYINRAGVPVAPGLRLDLRQPVTGFPHTDGPDTSLTVLAVTVDSELGTIETPNGKVVFCQLVGVTPAEKERMLASSTATVLDELRAANPLLVTDPARA